MTTTTKPATFTTCDTSELARQIGRGNIGAISGGRIIHRATGITLPVGRGYTVTVDLAGDDTYTVARVFTRGLKVWTKGTVSGVYCDEVGEMAYRASCFVNVNFGAHKVVGHTIATMGHDGRPVIVAEVRRGELNY